MAEVNQAAAAPRFQMEGVRKAFGATVAVAGVDFHVAPGEVCALVGQNGAGKSTLMAILSGALRPDAGVMRLDGRPYEPREPIDARRAGVAMIHQELSLAPHLTVMENIGLGMEPVRNGLIEWRRMRETAADALAQLGHPEIRPRRARRGPVAGGAAARRGRARAGERRPRRGARRADEQPRPRRRRAALRADPPAQRAGSRRRLHLALHRRSEGDLGPGRRLARRPQRRRRCNGGAAGGNDRSVDGRPRSRGSLSAQCETVRRGAARAERAAAGRSVADAAAAERLSASLVCLAPGAPVCCGRFSGWRRCGAAGFASACTRGRRRRRRAGRRAPAC